MVAISYAYNGPRIVGIWGTILQVGKLRHREEHDYQIDIGPLDKFQACWSFGRECHLWKENVATVLKYIVGKGCPGSGGAPAPPPISLFVLHTQQACSPQAGDR